MSLHIPEADWRRFKELHSKVLERYCSLTLEEAAAVSRSSEGTAHDRYVKLFTLIKEHDQQIAKVLDDFRRSTAVMQLGLMRRMKLLTDEELSAFSEETRTRVEGIASF